jgi:hypothetical protein
MSDGGKSVFARHTGMPEKDRQPTETMIKPRKPTRRTVDPKTFVADILTAGPVPTKTVLARGAERGLTRTQILFARVRLQAVAFKELGKNGPWFWSLPNHER